MLLASVKHEKNVTAYSFATAFINAGMKISMAKTEVLHLTKNLDQCSLRVNGATLKQIKKFKYLGVAFTRDRKQDEELDSRKPVLAKL